MTTFEDFMKSTRMNDRVVQWALRETEKDLLVAALIDLEEPVREIFSRNMSKRAWEMVQEELAQNAEGYPEGTKHKAREHLLQRLNKYVRYLDDDQEELGPLPQFAAADDEQLIRELLYLKRFIRTHGTLELETIINEVENPVLRRGLQLVIDGWEPLAMRTVMEQIKESYVSSISRRIDMIITGLDGLVQNEVPGITEVKLRSFLS